MAISKILNMKDCGGHFHGKHLKRSLDYVMNPEKTQDGRLIGAINCQVDSAFEQMKATKRKFGKVDKRQGYHIILSFKEDEVNPDTAFEITRRFVEEYLGKSYEAVYVVHDNTAHVHSHIVFNSVSFVDGKKYRYEKGDWAKYIQPITNKLCQEYGLSIIDVDDSSKEKEHESYKDWSEYREGSFVWADMIKRDLDSCILQAGNYEQFLELLSDKGYEVKQGKYLAVKPQGMTRFRRCKTLGDMYSDEAIRERIEKEDISFYREQQKEVQPVLCKCKVRRYRRAKMSGKAIRIEPEDPITTEPEVLLTEDYSDQVDQSYLLLAETGTGDGDSEAGQDENQNEEESEEETQSEEQKPEEETQPDEQKPDEEEKAEEQDSEEIGRAHV